MIIKGGITLNIREVSRMIGLSYSTTWKYLKVLEERGFIRITRSYHGAKITDSDFAILQEFVRLIRDEGISLEGALERLAKGKSGTDETVIEYLRRLEKKIEDLEKENKALREIVQKYLFEVEQLKGLPKPRDSFFSRISKFFRRKD